MFGRIQTTGQRFWTASESKVAIVSCKTCGAALFIDPQDKGRFDVVEVHSNWHTLNGIGLG